MRPQSTGSRIIDRKVGIAIESITRINGSIRVAFVAIRRCTRLTISIAIQSPIGVLIIKTAIVRSRRRRITIIGTIVHRTPTTRAYIDTTAVVLLGPIEVNTQTILQLLLLAVLVQELEAEAHGLDGRGIRAEGQKIRA